jgi:glycerol-3-phosphate dehydrogenase (NAD(P)+)
LPENLAVTSEIPNAEILVVCVPMQFLRGTLAALAGQTAPLVLCCKGLESGSFFLPPEVAADVLPGGTCAVLTGPNFAGEIAAGQPAASVLAAADSGLRAALTGALRSDTLRLYGSADVVGAALGENARAALITRGLAEIARLAVALGGKAETVAGLSGLGDLLLTCTGEKSRNFSLGLALGQGASLSEILRYRTNVTEGVATAPALLARAAAVGVEMPVAAAVTALLAGEMGVAETMAALMGRALKDE